MSEESLMTLLGEMRSLLAELTDMSRQQRDAIAAPSAESSLGHTDEDVGSTSGPFPPPAFPPTSAPLRKAHNLTKREGEVLDLLTQGLSNRLIAHRLRISERTVKVHLHTIYRKLSVATRTEAVVIAVRGNLGHLPG